MAQENANPFYGISLDSSQLREVAVKAGVDPRTVRRVIEGKPVRGLTGRRIRRVLQILDPTDNIDQDGALQGAFTITLVLTTDCVEPVDAQQVHSWVKETFEGCDMGAISILHVSKRG